MRQDNQIRRALSDLISVDAWHVDFESSDGSAKLHLEAVLGTARLGGDGASPIKFTVQIKTAEIQIILPASGSLSVDRKSIVRGKIKEFDVSEQSIREKGIKGEISLAASLSKFVPGFSLLAKIGRSDTKKLASEEKLKAIGFEHKTVKDEGCEVWKLHPNVGHTLSGRAWDGVETPLCTIVDMRSAEQKERDEQINIQPRVTVRVKCLREDLHIEDLEVVDPKANAELVGRKNSDKRLAAAESLIRDILVENSLGFHDTSSPFVELILFDELASAQKSV